MYASDSAKSTGRLPSRAAFRAIRRQAVVGDDGIEPPTLSV